jgi:hypothetical protein
MSNKIKNETVYRVDHVPGDEIDLEQSYSQMQSYREFDESGNLILEIGYAHDGEITDKIGYRYDDAGHLLESLIYGEDDEVLERKEVIRDSDGRVTKGFTHYLDGSADINEYFYDDKGNLTSMVVKDDEDEIEFSEKYYYEGDKVVKVERLNGDDEVIFRQEDEYVDGNIKTRTTWSSEEEEPTTLVQEFNAAGHREQELRYDRNDKLIERNIYEEDENGRVVRIIEENRLRKNTTELTYDELGNPVHQIETDLNGNLNHEVFRTYNAEGDLLYTTVEMVIKPGGEKRAYSMIIRKEMFGE